MHEWITEKSSDFALCGVINESAISFEVELPGLKGHCEKLRTGTRWQYKLAQKKLGEGKEDQLQGYPNIWETASTVGLSPRTAAVLKCNQPDSTSQCMLLTAEMKK